jgi:diguanylate cyclase (GGDEF)-like protein
MKKIWACGILGVVVTLFLTGYTVRLHKEVVLKEAQYSMRTLAGAVEKDLTRDLYGLDQTLLGLNNTLDAHTGSYQLVAPAVRRVIDDLLQENAYLTALMVLDSNGQILHWNNNFQKPDLSQRDYFRIHKRQVFEGLYIGQLQPSVINKDQRIFGISRAFRDQNGKLARVLVAIIDIKYFQRQYARLFSLAETRLTLFSDTGEIYFQLAATAETPNQEHEALLKLAQGTALPLEIHSRLSTDGEMQLATVRKIAGYPLLIDLAKMDRAIFSTWQKYYWNFMLLGIAVSLALLLLTYRTAAYQKRQNKVIKDLQLLAITDLPTGLHNRRNALEQAKLEIKKAHRGHSPLSIILFEVDHFKKLDEQYGFPTGDKTLKTLAGLLKETCRETDIISRFNADKFLLILPLTNLDDAIHIAKKIRTAISDHPYAQPTGSFQLTLSLGVTQWGEDETEAAGMLQRAEAALQAAIAAGRNNLKWVPSNIRDNTILQQSIWLNQNL